MSADQIEHQLSTQAAQLMRAAIMIARAFAVREVDARRAAARASLEHARALRVVTEQQRRLAAPIYRAARRDGWWDDPKISATERARVVGLAERFAHVDEDAREVAAEAHRRLEAEARARQAAEARAREESRNPQSFRDQRKDEFVDMTLVSVAELAAVAPLVDGEKLEQSLEEILEEIRMSDSVAAPKPAPDRGDIYTATQMLATAPDTPVPAQALDSPELTDNTTAIAWDTPQARHAWAQHLLDAGVDAEGVRAFTVASQAQPAPAQDMVSTPVNVAADRVPAAPLEEVHTIHR
ncbi:hypothetical protein HMPREF1478_00354 [Actinomyces sp. HPA0247]|uniref:hypothetical protein n=1 Tax=Actinomyces sp. HPA0247 TaxID=1203556 RepID=UPI00034E5910|nr:hypothetical protein [Actinomyces sp. HPA0247]EPD73647.1 hypothetical protein HMPREF1478_00354 [Actinomyces sp. HPA0247]